MMRTLRALCSALITVTIVLVSCKRSPPTVAVPTASAPQQVHAVAAALPPELKPCIPWDGADCDEKCQQGSAVNCQKLWQFYTHYARGATDSPHANPEIEAKATAAFQRAVSLAMQRCDGGDLSACDALSDGTLPRPHPPLPAGVEARAKERAGHLRDETERARNAACDAQDISACEALVRGGKPSRQPLEDYAHIRFVEHHLVAYRRVMEHDLVACNAGDGDACLKASWQLGAVRPENIVPSWPHAKELLGRACNAGSAEGCSDLSTQLAQQAKTESPAEASRLMDRSAALHRKALAVDEDNCRRGESKACDELGSALLGGKGIPADPRRAFSLLRRSCDLGSKDVCRGLVQSYLLAEEPAPTGLDKGEQRALETQLRHYQIMLCKEGDEGMCERIEYGRVGDERVGVGDIDEVDRIARMFCQRYDYLGIKCQSDTSYFDAFCRIFCEDGVGMHLPE